METANGLPAAVLIGQLEERPREFYFFQALRGLRLAYQQETGLRVHLFDLFRRHLRVRPELSLAFPPVDISDVERLPALHRGENAESVGVTSTMPLWRLTVTFLGLYGASSPLPTYYTEDLLVDRNQGTTVNRDLADVVNQPSYELLWLCWRRYRLPLRIVEEEDETCSRQLWAFGGRDPELLKKDPDKKHYTMRRLGLYVQHPRSGQALTTLLKDVLAIENIRIRPFAVRKKKLPADQRCRMGMANSRLGEDCVVGSAIDDCKSCFDLDIGPVDMNRYRSLLPGGSLHKKLRWHLKDFLDQPFDCMLNLFLEDDPERSARLVKGHWGSLGEDMWLQASRNGEEEAAGSGHHDLNMSGDHGQSPTSPVVSFFLSHARAEASFGPLQAASGQ